MCSWLYRKFTLTFWHRHFLWSFLNIVTFHVNDFSIIVDNNSTEIWCSWRKSEETQFSKQFKFRWKVTLKWEEIFMWKRVTMEICQCRPGKYSLNAFQQKNNQENFWNIPKKTCTTECNFVSCRFIKSCFPGNVPKIFRWWLLLNAPW